MIKTDKIKLIEYVQIESRYSRIENLIVNYHEGYYLDRIGCWWQELRIIGWCNHQILNGGWWSCLDNQNGGGLVLSLSGGEMRCRIWNRCPAGTRVLPFDWAGFFSGCAILRSDNTDIFCFFVISWLIMPIFIYKLH